jgi:hypothetical protein
MLPGEANRCEGKKKKQQMHQILKRREEKKKKERKNQIRIRAYKYCLS